MLPIIQGIISALLANNLPGVAQAVVDKGLDYVEEKTGIKLQPDMTAEQIAALRIEAQKHEEFLIEQDNKNTADARAMQAEALKQDDLFSKRFVYYFIALWSVAAISYIGFVTFGTVPPENVRIVDTLLGFIQGTIVATMFNYLLGSTNGSMKKTEIMGKVTGNAIK